MKDQIEEIEAGLRQGRTAWARDVLEGFRNVNVSRTDSLAISRLCRRVGLDDITLKLMAPFVHGEFSQREPASAPEVAEFALALTRLGASRRALRLLDKFRGEPDYNLNFAWMAALFARWRYDQAIPYIERYIESSAISPYERLVGQVNLLASYVSIEDFDRSARLIGSLTSELRSQNHLLLLANVFELAGQLEIYRGEFARAKNPLNESLRLLPDSNIVYRLFAEKWLAIADLLEGGPTKGGLARLREVRQKAIDQRNWETARDCDYYLAKVTRDEGLLLQLYFGTPYDRFRDKIRRALPKDFALPSTYTWAPLGAGNRCFNLTTATVEPDGPICKPDHLNFLLLHALCLDFYSPLSPGAIFSELFPEEIFDPLHSRDRVGKHVRRLRTFLLARRIPLLVQQERGEYRLSFAAPFSVRVPLRFNPAAAKETYFRRLYEKYGRQSFSTQDCISFLESSKATTVRILNWGIKEGLIERDGQTSAVLYRLKVSF